MPADYCFNFPLPNGLHARPASHFEAVASRFRSKITLILERTGVHANARSVLSMVSADVRHNDSCTIHIDGEDEQSALDAVRRFVQDELPRSDPALPELPAESSESALPRSLSAAGPISMRRGRAVSGGVAWGHAQIIGGRSIPTGLEDEVADDPEQERRRAIDAITTVAAMIQTKIAAAAEESEAQVLQAHSAIVRDEALAELILSLIQSKRRTAAQAIAEACRTFKEALGNSASAYLRERILDVEDVCIQLLDQVVHRDHSSSTPVLNRPSIVIAKQLTPGQFLALNREHVKGLVLADGGATSHTVILARSMNIPTLVGVKDAAAFARGADEVAVDGELGLLITELPEAVRRYYAMERERIEVRQSRLEQYRRLDAKTADGRGIEVGANISSADEAVIAFRNGAQGIGLFRTEMLFMDRDAAPTEQEQAQSYTTAAHAAGGHPVIIRLLDIGGDKPAPYLKLPAEDNPFLGFRGARLYREFAPMVKCQIRAILRAAASGDVRILVPMVCCLEEVREIRQMLIESAEELKSTGVTIERLPQLGVMLEIPSLAFLIPELCRELDFFSIGSNDLTQYLLAADRSNASVASLYTWSHPAFLRLLKTVVADVKAHGKWIGLCGELADQPEALPLLIGLGLDEISVSPSRITSVKAAIASLDFAHCTRLLDEVLKCGTRKEVEALAAASAGATGNAPLFSADLIFTSDCRTKPEVIKRLSDRLFLAGRTANPRLLEEAIWNREDTYSTGFGFGFALPHCKSEHLSSNSVGIVRLQSPVHWGSLDGNPVDVVILLAIRSQEPAGQHMKIFAKLSRSVMSEEFRDRIRAEADPVHLAEFLQRTLGQAPAPDAGN
jgi:fructose-specific PTS system IIA-like component